MVESSTTMTDRAYLDNLSSLFRKHPGLALFIFIALIVTCFWIVGYGFQAANTMYSHDGLMVDSSSDASWEIAQGRFLQLVYWQIRGTISAPLLVNILAIVWLSIAMFFAIKLLGISKLSFIALAIGIAAINPANTYINATYTPWIDAYQLALCFSVAAVYISQVKNRIVLPSVLIAASLALYQNYITVYLFLLLAVLIKNLLCGLGLKESLVLLLKGCIVLLIGCVVYYCAWQIVLMATGEEVLSSYHGFDRIGNYEGISIFSLLKDTYCYPFEYISKPETFHPTVSGVLSLLFLVVAAIWIIVRAVQIRSARKTIVIIVALAVMPLAINCTYFVSKGVVHTLMLEPYCFLYIAGLAAIIDLPTAKIGKKEVRFQPMVSLLLCIIVFFNAVFANDAMLKKRFIYEATDSVVTRVCDRIEMTDGYQIGKTPVLFIGEFRNSPLFAKRNSALDSINGVGFYRTSITHEWSTDQWLQKIYGYNYKSANSDERKKVTDSDEIADMGVFPAEDSIRFIDGVLVVKIAEEKK